MSQQPIRDDNLHVQDQGRDVIEAARILVMLSKDPRLTPTALDRFREEIPRAIKCEPVENRKRSFEDFATPMVSKDVAIYIEDARRKVFAKSRMISRLPTPRPDNGGFQGMAIDFDTFVNDHANKATEQVKNESESDQEDKMSIDFLV
jgi:hypothetical protein